MFIFLCHINHIHKLLLFFLHPFILPSVVVSHKWTSRFMSGDYTVKLSFRFLLPVIKTVRIAFHILIRPIIYEIMNVVDLSKFSIHSQKWNTFMKSTRQYPRQYRDWVKLIIKQKCIKYWMFFQKLYSVSSLGPV